MRIIAKVTQIIKKVFTRQTIVNVNVAAIALNQILQDRCALITGGSSGIGYAIARAFLNAGCNVCITGRNEDKLHRAFLKLKAIYPDRVILETLLDNTNVDSFEPAFNNLLLMLGDKGIGQIDILVNNAGVNFKGMPNATEQEYDAVMDTNLKGAFFLSQLFGRYIVENQIHGNILNIASSSSLRPADSAYTLSKWGIRALTLGLAKSLAKYGITVNGLAPGPTATHMMMKNGSGNMYLGRIPFGRYIMPEEIANMSVILVSDIGRSIMGDVVYMTGGAGILTYDDVPYNFDSLNI
jgi:NAD(P)-dependent dehydrogenase (short-subunit alcohol dehydrogenase family)